MVETIVYGGARIVFEASSVNCIAMSVFRDGDVQDRRVVLGYDVWDRFVVGVKGCWLGRGERESYEVEEGGVSLFYKQHGEGGRYSNDVLVTDGGRSVLLSYEDGGVMGGFVEPLSRLVGVMRENNGG